MPGAFRLDVVHDQQLKLSETFDRPVELGRQQRADEPLFTRQAYKDGWRLAVAASDEVTIARVQLRIEASGTGVRLTNLSPKNSVYMEQGSPLSASASAEFSLPVQFTLYRTQVTVDAADGNIRATADDLRTLSSPTLLPGALTGPKPGDTSEPITALSQYERQRVVKWLRTIIGVLQSAANSNDFFARAAGGIVDLAGLDSGGVLLWQEEAWKVQSIATRDNEAAQRGSWKPSQTLLSRMRDEKRTFWTAPQDTGSITASLAGVQAVVVAPILDAHACVIGALYGDRRVSIPMRSAPEITQIEAMVVEALACGVAAGLARVEQERAALAAQIRFEQFFTPELAQELALRPDLLTGRDAEVTLLFCDVRGFSRISERVGPRRTVEWLGEVMSTLSECVARHSGVLVDFVGDELLAMWGAPRVQADHAQLACLAALDMLVAMPALDARWKEQLGESTRVGIGINTGVAHVGNTGSNKKFKYGPLGNSVNLASRVEGATKYLKAPVLITGATRKQATSLPMSRRLGQVRVVNIAEPVELHEIRAANEAERTRLFAAYEQALDAFEQQQFQQAAKQLGEILAEFPMDGPSLTLLARAVEYMREPPNTFDAAWQLQGK
jgi:adenylate cyclase